MCVQLRVVTRLGIALTSTDFKAAEYYPNIRKAVVAGYFMQARPRAQGPARGRGVLGICGGHLWRKARTSP